MTITTLPPAPSRGDPATFADKGDALLGALATFVTETNATAASVTASEASATASASAAATSEANAAASAAGAAASAGVVLWVSGTTYAIGDEVFSPTDLHTYRRRTAGAGTTDPSADSTNWQRLTGMIMTRVARTSDTQLAASNIGNLIDVTSGTFTQTFAAAATLGAGWFCWYRNSGTGTVTLTGLSLALAPNGFVLLQCDGSTLRATAVRLSDYQEFTGSGSCTIPSWAIWIYVEAIGGGGGGANHTSTTATGGGGGGGFNSITLRAADVTSPVTVTIGAAGTAGATAGNNNGGNGGDTTFGSYLTAPGGKGGTSGLGANAANAGRSGSGAKGGVQSTGFLDGSGGFGGGGGGCNSGLGGNAIAGGGGGGGSGASAGTGGTSSRGGAGGAGNAAASTVATAGSAPGGGGGASTNDGGGGAGAVGRVRVWSW